MSLYLCGLSTASILPFAVIHNPANGRLFVGRDLDEVKPGFGGQGQGPLDINYPYLHVFFVY